MVQVLKVWANNLMTLIFAVPEVFICSHNKFLSDEEFWKLPTSLFSISLQRREVTFIQTRDRVYEYDTRQHPMVSTVLKETATLLYKVPLDGFLRYTDSVNTSKRWAVVLHHSYRCGSTLWAQVFNCLPGWRVLSECNYMLAPLIKSSDDILSVVTSQLYRRAIVAGIRFFLSQVDEGTSVLIKTSFFDQYAIRVIAEEMPDVVLL